MLFKLCSTSLLYFIFCRSLLGAGSGMWPALAGRLQSASRTGPALPHPGAPWAGRESTQPACLWRPTGVPHLQPQRGLLLGCGLHKVCHRCWARGEIRMLFLCHIVIDWAFCRQTLISLNNLNCYCLSIMCWLIHISCLPLNQVKVK